ncbi:MAG TPA: group-specific protein [Spirochaetota bacterium]|nr:group-specific protein [Spirochaetota bacterium]
MKFYLASSLANSVNADRVINYLIWKEWMVTYDWTSHGAVEGARLMEDVSQKEIAGVREADVFFLLLPGRHGSHVELGAALALRKPVVILSPSQDLLFQDELAFSFYWHPSVVEKIIDDDIFNLSCRAHKCGKKLVRV